jgi:succinate dehydrogenase hydrophobic anchor subunit
MWKKGNHEEAHKSFIAGWSRLLILIAVIIAISHVFNLANVVSGGR